VSKENISLGKTSEEAAVKFLKNQGYRILARNYRCFLGEIDIIAKDKDTFCFIEVKSRSSDRFGLPQEAVSQNKRRRIIQTALVYLKEKNLLERKARFDVIALRHEAGEISFDLIKNAFELDNNLD